MKIKSIQFSNFGCYKGIHPLISFSTSGDKNVTIILGANKTGKTTLVQAFLWCLYGEVSPNYGIINSEIKTEMKHLSSCDVFVEIILFHAGREYTIRRTQRFSKLNESIKNEESLLKIQYKETSGEQQLIPLRDCSDTIQNILPKGLSDYFFYEGERFVDISKKDVATAVRGLMGLDAISVARDHLDPKRAASVISKMKKGLLLGDPQKNDHLKQNLAEKQEEREKILERIETSKQEQEYFLRRKEDFVEMLSNNEYAKSLQIKRKNLESDIKFGEDNIARSAKQILSHFQQGALSFFSLPLIESAMKVIENQGKKGEGITDMRQPAIDQILQRKRCICGCNLEENEGARKHLLMERSLLPPAELGTVLHSYKQILLSYRDLSKGYIEGIDNNYQEWRKSIRFLDDKNKDIEKVSDDLLSTGLIDIERIESDYQENEEKIKELQKKYENLIEKKAVCEHEIEKLQKEIDSLVEKTDSNKKIIRYIAYADALFNMLNKSYSDREHEVKIDLNESINSIFSEMYHGHRKVIINDNYQIKLLTTIGASQEEIADTGGLRAIKNFAYITGLVDIARKRIARKKSSDEENFHETEPYPLIMDAPFSATDEKHIENISKIIPSIAEQVIIIVMQKDWAYAKAIIKDKIGKSYTIENIENSETRSKIREGE